MLGPFHPEQGWPRKASHTLSPSVCGPVPGDVRALLLAASLRLQRLLLHVPPNLEAAQRTPGLVLTVRIWAEEGCPANREGRCPLT